MKHFLLLSVFFLSFSLFAQQGNQPAKSGDQIAMVGADRAPMASDVNTYPNPVTEFLFIEVDFDHFAPSEYKFFDILGNVVLEGKFEKAEQVRLDLSALHNEVYFLRIFDQAGNSITKRVIKK
jgi:hypothetical protein